MRPGAIAALAALLLATASARAGGLFVPDVGPQAQARAGAFVAKADDASALAHNPAGLALIDGTELHLGVNLVDFWLTYERAGTFESTARKHDYEGAPYPSVSDISSPSFGVAGFQPVPLVAVSSDLGLATPLRLALGVYAPQGYPSRAFYAGYPVTGSGVKAPGPQRYDSIEQQIVALLPSLGVAYRVASWLDAGLRASWGIASIRSKSALWGLRNFEESPDKDGVFLMEAEDGFVPGFGAGLLFHPHASIDVGLAYSSALSVRARGTGTTSLGADVGLAGLHETIEPVTDPARARCATDGRVGALATCLNLTVPQTVTAGARWRWSSEGRERADVELDVRWEDWSAGSDYEVIVDGKSGLTGIELQPVRVRHGFRDVLSTRLAGAYAFDLSWMRLGLRAGAAYDTAAAPDSWSRVDLDGASRITLAGGVSVELWRLRLDLGGGIVLEPTRTVTLCAAPDGPSNGSPGCDGSGLEAPVSERQSPDPLQPLASAEEQSQSPYNAGRYRSGYYLLSVGITTWF